MFCNVGFAEIFEYICKNDKNFQKIYKIDTVKKTIKHLTSYDFDREVKYEMNKYVLITHWSDDFINWSYVSSANTPGFHTLSLKDGITISSAHYISGDMPLGGDQETDKYVYSQIYKCYRK